MVRSATFILSTVVVAGLLAVPAAADLLVTRSGEVVETRGEWEVKGKVVLFTGVDGQLRSLRLVDLDLGESERRTRAAVETRRKRESQRAATEAVPVDKAVRKAVLVVTDADVRHVGTAPSAAGGEDEGDGDADAVDARESDGRASLRVSEWSDDVGSDGLEISGTLQNDSDGLVAGISLAVDLLADDGSVVESVAARVGRRSLAAGESSRFTASFRSFFVAREPEFKPHGFLLAPTQSGTDDSAEPPTGLP